jgi:hypothetical protein
MEEAYIGTKTIAAEPMDEFTFSTTQRPAYNTVAINEKGQSRPGYKVRYEDGYISWSPKETFERAYRLITVHELELICSVTPVERCER